MRALTELLYLDDSYLREFTARVTAAEDGAARLDRTAFYPTGGGQPHDTGALQWEGGEAQVVKVKKAQGDVVHHLEGGLPPEGAEVTGRIHWQRRYNLMRHHTAAHVVSAVIYDEWEALATGGQLYEDRARLDFELPDWEPEMARRIEAEVNRVVREDHPLKWYEVSRKEYDEGDLTRLKADLLPRFIDPVRVVEIVGVDAQADGGTHVRSTAEVGEVTITNVKSKGKENRRLYFELAAREAPG